MRTVDTVLGQHVAERGTIADLLRDKAFAASVERRADVAELVAARNLG
ncbi:hypothetical protein [Kibdelosporangium phytohabitans]|nr:hypothetical protein [Kibdelosporangium phytohabitans]MBE1468488.1 hypothetical protein [Kibdelosporangium phytohabitans]